jgi:hypothetical protein
MNRSSSRLVSAGVLLTAVLSLPTSNAAQITDLPHTDGTFTIDGVMDEAAWKNATAIDIDNETHPSDNIPARVKTVAYIIENGESLYIAFDAKDPQPEAIRAYLRDRDSAWNDDFVGIVLDTYNDERRAFEFFVNALGVQMDLTNDDVNKREDDSWDAIWDSAGHINESGFIVEMEIPLNQLRFPSIEGKQTWGIDLLRFYPRDKRYRFSNNKNDRSVNCYLCQFDKIQGLADVKPQRDLEIVPTVIGSRVDTTDDPGVVPLTEGDAEGEVGVNIRWGITPDLTANLAINPDFSQVEADVAQLDVNNQFTLFYPEKRPFFLEGADYFRTPMRAVFTRTVSDPAVGLKLTGKRDKNTFGVFAAQDDVTNLLFPGAFGSDSTSLDEGNTAFVGRYGRSFGDASNVGALLTVRDGDNYHNYVGGLDSHWKISDQHSADFQYLHSETEYPDEVADEFEQPLDKISGDAYQLGYRYDSRDWVAWANHQRVGADFRADSGFIPKVDRVFYEFGGGRVWHGKEDDWWTRMQWISEWNVDHDTNGQLLEREAETYFFVSGPMQSHMEVGVLLRDTRFEGVTYNETKGIFFGQVQPKGGLVLRLHGSFGDQVDFDNGRLGDELRFSPEISWNVSRNLLARIDASFVTLDNTDGENIFDAKVYDIRLTWQFNSRSFLRFTTQRFDIERNQALYDDDIDEHSRDVGRQLLYSYKLNPQTVFFLGYSDQYVDEDQLSELTETDRSLFMKIGYAWTP